MDAKKLISKIFLGITGISIVCAILSVVDIIIGFRKLSIPNIITAAVLIACLIFFYLDYKRGGLFKDNAKDYSYFGDLIPQCLLYNIFINNIFIRPLWTLDYIVRPAFALFFIFVTIMATCNIFKEKPKRNMPYILIVISIFILLVNIVNMLGAPTC